MGPHPRDATRDRSGVHTNTLGTGGQQPTGLFTASEIKDAVLATPLCPHNHLFFSRCFLGTNLLQDPLWEMQGKVLVSAFTWERKHTDPFVHCLLLHRQRLLTSWLLQSVLCVDGNSPPPPLILSLSIRGQGPLDSLHLPGPAGR